MSKSEHAGQSNLNEPFEQHLLALREHLPSELAAVARMNREMNEDGKHRNRMTVPELTERLKRFVADEGWRVALFTYGDETVGYVTYRYEPDGTERSGQRVNLMHFFIARNHRKKGLGAAAFNLFKRSRLKSGDRIFLEVRESNPNGKAFWKQVGFEPYASIMEQVV